MPTSYKKSFSVVLPVSYFFFYNIERTNVITWVEVYEIKLRNKFTTTCNILQKCSIFLNLAMTSSMQCSFARQ